MEHSNPDGLPKIKGYNIINGQLKLASDESTFLSINPAVLADELGEFPLSTRDDVHDAIAAARTALTGWAATPAPTRGQIIGNMGRLLMEYKDDLVRLQDLTTFGLLVVPEVVNNKKFLKLIFLFDMLDNSTNTVSSNSKTIFPLNDFFLELKKI